MKTKINVVKTTNNDGIIPVRKTDKQHVPRKGDINLRDTEPVKESVFVAGIMLGTLLICLLITMMFIQKANATTNAPASHIKEQDINTAVRYGKSLQALKVWKSHIVEMKARGYGDTHILDLLAIKTMECNNYRTCEGMLGKDGKPNDIGPFQINAVHAEAYSRSMKLHNNKQWGELFKFQLTKASNMLKSFDDRFCNIKWAKTNERRFKCLAISYNGHPRYKKAYAQLAWMKREKIKALLYTNP